MIAELPSLTGGVNVIVAWPLPAVAVPIVGAPGTVAGEIELLGLDATLVPTLLVAVTVNVYALPLASPVTVSGEALPVAVKPPVFDVTVYEVMVDPPFDAGGVNEIVAWPLPRTAVTPVGAFGTVTGVTEFEAEEFALLPTLFVATTVNVYVVPFVKPVTVSGDEPPVAVKLPIFEVTV